jgi:Na+/melibiose symporter-like transporter
MLGFIIVLGAAGVAGALALHIKTFFWELTPNELSLLFGVGAFSTLIGYAISTRLTRMLDKRGALILGAAGWGVIQMGMILWKLAGWFPDPGALALGCLMASSLLQAVFGAQVFVAVASMLADITDQHQLDSGQQQAGMFFGAFSFSTKAAQGLGVAAGGIVLDLVDWPVGQAAVKTTADIPADALVNLALAFGPALALMMIPAIWCISRYTLTREAHARIRAQLDTPRTIGKTSAI